MTQEELIEAIDEQIKRREEEGKRMMFDTPQDAVEFRVDLGQLRQMRNLAKSVNWYDYDEWGGEA